MFVDTSGWASLADRRQTYHLQASELVQAALDAGETLITTNFVLAELTALLTSPLRIPKARQIQWLENIRTDSAIETVVIDPSQEAAAWNLWRGRSDKDWTLVDCAASSLCSSSACPKP